MSAYRTRAPGRTRAIQAHVRNGHQNLKRHEFSVPVRIDTREDGEKARHVDLLGPLAGRADG
jgi:hypothetical protein